MDSANSDSTACSFESRELQPAEGPPKPQRAVQRAAAARCEQTKELPAKRPLETLAVHLVIQVLFLIRVLLVLFSEIVQPV